MRATSKAFVIGASCVLGLLTAGASAVAQTGTLFVEGDNVGIGVATPSSDLQLDSNTSNGNVFLVRSTADNSLLRIFETTSGGGLMSIFNSAGQEAFRMTAIAGGRIGVGCVTPSHDLDLSDTPGAACDAGGARSFIDAGDTTFTVSSSRTLKENLEPVAINDILERVGEVPVYHYDFIDGPKDRLGLVAEDFHVIFNRGSDKVINGAEIQMALWLAVQELTERNDTLEARNVELVERIERLEKAQLATAEN